MPKEVAPKAVALKAVAPPAPRAGVSAESYEASGRRNTADGRYQEAIADLTAAIQLHPQLARTWNARGYAHFLNRSYPEAIADFTQAIRLDRKYANAYHNRAAARRASGDPTGAQSDTRQERSLARR